MKVKRNSSSRTQFTVNSIHVAYTTYLTSLGVQRHKLTFSGDQQSMRCNQIDTPDKTMVLDKLARQIPNMPARCLMDVLTLEPRAA